MREILRRKLKFWKNPDRGYITKIGLIEIAGLKNDISGKHEISLASSRLKKRANESTYNILFKAPVHRLFSKAKVGMQSACRW